MRYLLTLVLAFAVTVLASAHQRRSDDYDDDYGHVPTVTTYTTVTTCPVTSTYTEDGT